MKFPQRTISNALLTLSFILLIADVFVFIHWAGKDVVQVTALFLLVPLCLAPGIRLYKQIPLDKTWHDVPIKIWLQSMSRVLLSIMWFFLFAQNFIHPQRNSWFGPAGLVFGLFSAFDAYWVIHKLTREQRIQRRTSLGLCIKCGYDLRASPNRCPECGTIPNIEKPFKPAPQSIFKTFSDEYKSRRNAPPPKPRAKLNDALPPGRRIVVVGTSGSGKSHVAQRLASLLHIPYVCNDAILWRPNWTPNPRPQRYIEYDAATHGDTWTFDGNLGSLKDPEDALILNRADTLVWLDLPHFEIMRQIILRSIVRAWTRHPLWHGNIETWRHTFAHRDSIIRWAWTTHAHRRRQYTRIFSDPRWSHLRRIRLTSRAAVNRWLERITDHTAACQMHLMKAR